MTESIYRKDYDDPRFLPSALAAQRVAGGLLGSKTGDGLYCYENGAAVEGLHAYPGDPRYRRSP